MSGREFRLVACLLAGFAAPLHVYAQAQETPSTPSIKAKAEDVLLDIVVRDKKGHLVTNLKADDF